VQQDESHLATRFAFVASIRKERLFMATGALSNGIDRCTVNACCIQLQSNAFLQVKLPVAQSDFFGDALPLAGALTKKIPHRPINFIAVGSDTGTDRGTDLSGLATEDFAHRHNGSLQQAGRGATPSQVDDSGDVFVAIIEDNREAVRNKDAEQYVALVGNDRVTFDTLKMRDLRIGLVDDQDLAAMDLSNSQKKVWLETEVPGDKRPVCFNLGLLVTGAETEVERIERWSAAAAIAGRKAGRQLCPIGPGRLHEVNLALFNCFHRITFQQDPNEEQR